MSNVIYTLRSMGLAFAIAACGTAFSQQTVVNWNVANGNWTAGSNWDSGTQPDSFFDELANISNDGTATIDSTIAVTPGEVVLGLEDGESGTLSIENGGSLSVVLEDGNTSDGGVDVGRAGAASLTVTPGGSLTAQSLFVNGQSSLTIGGAGGVSTVSIVGPTGAFNDINLSGTTRVTGAGHSISVVDDLVLNGDNTLIQEITSAAHTVISVGDRTILGGTLKLEFGGGVVPTVGDSWDLIDAAFVDGAFAVIEAPNASLGPGERFEFSSSADAGSTNGVIGSVSLNQTLTLTVDRATGGMTLGNLGSVGVDFDGFTISSALGGIDSGSWNSLQDQLVSDWRESPAGGGSNTISELKPSDSTNLAGGTSFDLGNAFSTPTPTEIGTELEDIAFQYFQPDGSVVDGFVEYVGEKKFNNIVLTVDPTTGEAQMENESSITVEIDGYQIISESGSLLSSDGSWSSLDDQGVAGGDWRESNVSPTRLTELSSGVSGVATELSTGTRFNLGNLFLVAGTQDLSFEFLLDGETVFTQGVVVYGAIQAGLEGDFNNDGMVNLADYTVWRDNLGGSDVVLNGNGAGQGTVGSADYQLWKSNFGATSGAGSGSLIASSTVPEPASGLAIAVALLFVAPIRSRYLSTN